MLFPASALAFALALAFLPEPLPESLEPASDFLPESLELERDFSPLDLPLPLGASKKLRVAPRGRS